MGWVNPVLRVLVCTVGFMQADQGTATVITPGARELCKTWMCSETVAF